MQNIHTNWDRVIFSDESAIRKNYYNKKKWIHKNDTIITKTVKYPFKKTFGDVFLKILLDQFMFFLKTWMQINIYKY